MCHGGNPSVKMTVSNAICQVGSKKTDKANPNTEVSLAVETGHFSRTFSEYAVLYEMAAHLVYDICRLQINNLRLLFADCK